MAESKTTVTRTSRGLVDALFDTIDKLNAKAIDAEHARAISHTAKSIVNIAMLELEYRRFAADQATAVEALTSLQISPPATA